MENMATARLTKWLFGFRPVTVLSLGMLVSLYLMGVATENSAQFGRWFIPLLVFNAIGLIFLLVVLGANLLRLVQQLRARVMGSRMTLRLTVLFVILSVIPVSVMYYFSLQFLHRGIESWFDVRVEQALSDSLDLSRSALDVRMRQTLRLTQEMASELVEVPAELAAVSLSDQRDRTGAHELTLLTHSARILSSSNADPGVIIPSLPNEAIMLQMRSGKSYVGLDPVSDSGLYIRAVVEVPNNDPTIKPYLMQALFPVTERMSRLASNVQEAYAQYAELSYLRKPLKFSFTLILSLVLMLGLMTAVLTAVFFARRLVSPIRHLAEGTRAVAEGDYNKRLPSASSDEMGLLVFSFNEMTDRIAEARDAQHKSQHELETQRSFLESVLGNLSSGVMTIDGSHRLRTVNATAGIILDVDIEKYLNKKLEKIADSHVSAFVDKLLHHIDDADDQWQEEVTLFGTEGRQVLMCRGTQLPQVDADEVNSYVIVFDDVTVLMQAQRDKAWSEVARRLAHEIKNPLTPIQLSAERLRHKYLKQMNKQDADVLDRSTHTIVQQVEVMKEMVKAFSDYARSPQVNLQTLDLNMLIKEVLDLYQSGEYELELELNTAADLPLIEADAGRMRQLLHNLIKNALEALEGSEHRHISITTRSMDRAGTRYVELQIHDTGPGFPQDMLEQVFEPYITTKTKGTGLGLAIVKKVVEEHGGVLWAENQASGGASITIRLPASETGHARQDASSSTNENTKTHSSGSGAA